MPELTHQAATGRIYQEIAQQIRDDIAGGALRPGDRVPSLRVLCRQYGVALETVNKAHRVLEAEGLIVRSQRSGAFVAHPARKPATGIIGFSGVDFARAEFSSYWARLLEGVETGLQAHGMRLLLMKYDAPGGWDQIDGLLVNSAEAYVLLNKLPARLPIAVFFPPAVFMDDKSRRVPAAKVATGHPLFGITADDYTGMYQATQHLIDLGHRRIAFLNNSLADNVIYPRRLAGYRDALREAGIAPDPRWLRAIETPTAVRLFFMKAGRETMKRWLDGDWRELGCTALLAHNDDAAWGAMESLREAGMVVPRDVSVVGYDDTDAAEFCSPRLTTVAVPLQQMGECGVELLWRQLGGEAVTTENVLPTQLRVRASTAPPP